jgi:8-oxo-dGTP pyrophosphatase MutT (NUDIX family)
MSIPVISTKRFAIYDNGTKAHDSRSGSKPCSSAGQSANAANNEGSRVSGDDDCYSLYYDKVPGSNGSGFQQHPQSVISPETIAQMHTVHPEHARLPFDFYKMAVESLPIVCVDVVCKRNTDNKLLLFFRRDKPAASIWWWPGGRMFKGETFFDTAVRKILDETGIRQNQVDGSHWTVKPVSVLNTWNTFFPDSNWDVGRTPGREGTQTVNICVYCELIHDGSEERPHQVKENEGNEMWAVEAKRWVTADEILANPCMFDKYVSVNVLEARKRSLL